MSIDTSSSGLNDLLTIVQGGGNVALVLCVYFIRDASQRLARIEARLAVALRQHDMTPTTRVIPDG